MRRAADNLVLIVDSVTCRGGGGIMGTYSEYAARVAGSVEAQGEAAPCRWHSAEALKKAERVHMTRARGSFSPSSKVELSLVHRLAASHAGHVHYGGDSTPRGGVESGAPWRGDYIGIYYVIGAATAPDTVLSFCGWRGRTREIHATGPGALESASECAPYEL